jgi:hypothetical protein
MAGLVAAEPDHGARDRPRQCRLLGGWERGGHASGNGRRLPLDRLRQRAPASERGPLSADLSGRLAVDGSPDVLKKVDEYAGEEPNARRPPMTYVSLDSARDLSGEPSDVGARRGLTSSRRASTRWRRCGRPRARAAPQSFASRWDWA